MSDRTPAWWLTGLSVTLIREGVNKHRAKEIADGWWQAYCSHQDDDTERLRADAERWNWFVRHASLGFDQSPSWNAVIRLPVFSSDDDTITKLVDRGRREAK